MQGAVHEDLRWRVMASENEIKRKFEPVRGKEVICKRLDETETAIDKQPERLLGISVRYLTREIEIADIEEEKAINPAVSRESKVLKAATSEPKNKARNPITGN